MKRELLVEMLFVYMYEICKTIAAVRAFLTHINDNCDTGLAHYLATGTRGRLCASRFVARGSASFAFSVYNGALTPGCTPAFTFLPLFRQTEWELETSFS